MPTQILFHCPACGVLYAVLRHVEELAPRCLYHDVSLQTQRVRCAGCLEIRRPVCRVGSL